LAAILDYQGGFFDISKNKRQIKAQNLSIKNDRWRRHIHKESKKKPLNSHATELMKQIKYDNQIF
jgi:hypothetical protein